MREIEFRVWDGTRMHYGGFSVHATGLIINSVFVDKNPVLMQYTGLEDKNGKKIFEGDLVKHVTCCAKHEGNMNISIVEYKGITLKPFGDQMQGDTYQQSYNYEIIGNIHKNPKLLI